MKKYIILILLGAFSQQVFSYSDIKEKGYLRVAVYKNYAPFSYREKGKLQGIEVDLGKLLASKLDVDPLIWAIGADENMEDDLRNTIWKGHYLGGGTADVMLHVPMHKLFAENNDKVIIDNAYFTEEIVASRHNSYASIPLIKLFGEKKIGVELDTLPDFFMVGTQGGRFNENVIHYATVTEAVHAMVKGEISCVVAPRSQIDFALSDLREEYLSSDVTMPRSYQAKWIVGMAVKEGRVELMSMIKKALKDIEASGELSKLFKKYNINYRKP